MCSVCAAQAARHDVRALSTLLVRVDQFTRGRVHQHTEARIQPCDAIDDSACVVQSVAVRRNVSQHSTLDTVIAWECMGGAASHSLLHTPENTHVYIYVAG